MPDPVHDHTKPGRVSDSKSFQPDHRYMEVGHHKDDQNVGEKETGYGNQKIREKCGASIVESTPANCRANPDGKRKGPGDDSAHNEKGKTVEKPFPDLSED